MFTGVAAATLQLGGCLHRNEVVQRTVNTSLSAGNTFHKKIPNTDGKSTDHWT